MRSQYLPLVGEAKRKSVAAEVKGGEGERKPLAEDFKLLIGAAIARAIEASGLTKQSVAYDMGYRTKDDAPDASALSRWIAGVETPQFAKLFAIPALRAHLVIALADLSEDVTVETVVRLQRRRA